MLTAPGASSELRGDLSLLNRLGIVSVVALVSAVTGSPAALLATVLAHTAWPISMLAPMRWRQEISEESYVRASMWFLPGLATVMAAAYGSSRGDEFPTTMLVIGAGAVHLLVVLLVAIRRRQRPRWISMMLGGAVAGIAGVLVDVSGSLGWGAATMTSYGFVGVGAVAATRDILRKQPAA